MLYDHFLCFVSLNIDEQGVIGVRGYRFPGGVMLLLFLMMAMVLYQQGGNTPMAQWTVFGVMLVVFLSFHSDVHRDLSHSMTISF